MKSLNQIFNPIESRLQLYNSDHFLRFNGVTIENLFTTIDQNIYAHEPNDVIVKIDSILTLIETIKAKGDKIVGYVTTDLLHAMDDLDSYYEYQSEVYQKIKFEIKQFEKQLKYYKIKQTRVTKTTIQIPEKRKNTPKPSTKKFSQKQVAIAYFMMGIIITEKNAISILEKHSNTSSLKILQKLYTKPSQLTALSDNHAANTKHKNDLKAAKQLLSGMKNKKGVEAIIPIIAAFETAYNSKY